MDTRRFSLQVACTILLSLGSISSTSATYGLEICGPEDPPQVKSVEAEFPQVTESEAKNWAALVEKAVIECDTQQQIVAFDWTGLKSLVVADLDVTPKMKMDLEQQFHEIQLRGGLLGEVAHRMGNDGTFKLLRITLINGHRRTVFRVVDAKGELSYIEFVVVRGLDGTPKAIDSYAHLWGERYSTILRRYLTDIPAESDSTLRLMAYHTSQGNPAVALQVYDTLPSNIRFQKPILMRRYGAATALRFQSPHLSDSEVRSTLDDFRKYYPNEISHELLAIDYFSAQHEWTSAFAAIDRLNDYIGGDPYLHQLRGNVHYRKGDYESAHREFAVACTAVPDQPMVWLGAIAVALVEREHDEVLNLMILADKSARMDWDSVGTFTGWIDFESSPQFDKWIAYLKK